LDVISLSGQLNRIAPNQQGWILNGGATWENRLENRRYRFGGAGHSVWQAFPALYWEISYTGGFLYIILWVSQCFSPG
jgi:hypothetical protein